MPPPSPSQSTSHSTTSSVASQKTGFKFRAHDFVSHQQAAASGRFTTGSSTGTGSQDVTSNKTTIPAPSPSQEEQEDQEFFESSYEMRQFLGKGRQGAQVFACHHRDSGELRAVKVWRKSRRQTRNRFSTTTSPYLDLEEIHLDNNSNSNSSKPPFNPELTEFYLMQHLHHPNVAKIFELLEGPTHYYMVMEYSGGGTLAQDLKQQPGERYPEDKAALLIYLLLQTVAYLHSSRSNDENDQDTKRASSSASSRHYVSRSLIHCDLNLHNIILDKDKEKVSAIKLVDFGDAVLAEPDDDEDDDDYYPNNNNDNNHHNTNSYAQEMAQLVDWYQPRGAQIPFMAPEMIAIDQPFGSAADMWSLGVLAFILVSGKYPFGKPTTTLQLQHAIKALLALRTHDCDSDILFGTDLVWNDVSAHAKDFIAALLQHHPHDRPTAEEALRHVWMEKTRERALDDKLAGGGTRQHKHLRQHALQVWSGLKQTARRRPSTPKVLKQAALTFIATQLVLKEEKSYIDEVFQLMDIEADGVLSKQEVRKGYQEIFGKPLKETDLEALFERVDLGGSGTIEYSEFVIASLNEKQLLHTTKLRKAFEIFDTNNTGFISAANLQPLLKSYLAEHDEQEHVAILEEIIAQVDRDGDGQICFDEFVAMMLHSSNGRRRRVQRPNSRGRRPLASSVNSSLTTSMLMVEPPNIFASSTSTVSSGERRELWESSIQLTFRPAQTIGKRAERLTSRYDIGEYIQSGSFGSVWFCTNKESGAERAVKYVKKSQYAKENELIMREFNILRSLDHPNILKMYELFESSEQYEIVMDASKGGDLCDEIDKYGAIAEVGVCLILHQILLSVNYCHQRHIVHCDLKPDNILLEESKAINQIKIIDFGLAANLVGEQEKAEGSVVNGRIKERRGTIRFMAPEVLKGDYGPKCDVWACGVMAFLLLSDEFPFTAKHKQDIVDRILSGAYSFSRNPIWKNISDDAKSFISDCLTMDETKRPTAALALQHPWLETARLAVAENFHEKEVCTAAEALDNMKRFQARSVLAQAASTFIASQLILKEEKAKIDEVFRVMDVSCDGKLSKQEVKAAYLKVFGYEMSVEEVDEIFDRVDIDGTGYLEYSEFVVAAMSQKELLSNDNLKKAFSVFDQHNRGYITRSSLKRGLTNFLSSNGNDGTEDEQLVSDRVLHKIISEVDRSGDGRITYDDFVATMLNSADVRVDNDNKEEKKQKKNMWSGLVRMFDGMKMG